jgi:hypothetical protein
MLNSFFKLNDGGKRLSSERELLELIRHGDGLRDILFEPDRLALKRPENKIKDKNFTNVSFAKTLIEGLEFTRCKFVDCLFIATVFRGCEFHDCTFVGCNPYRVRFEDTYIDPVAFAGLLDPKIHSNIGVRLFQQLLHNSHGCQQPEFARQAHYYFQKWKRYQLSYDYRRKEIKFYQYVRKWLPSFFYDHLCGYGIRIRPFVRLTVVFVVACTVINHFLWGAYQMHNSTGMALAASPVVSIYYTIITMTTLGYGDYTPTAGLGMLASSCQAVFGIVWLSLLASIIIKRVSK